MSDDTKAARADSKLLKIRRETMFPRRQPQSQKTSWKPYIFLTGVVFLMYLLFWSPFDGDSSGASSKEDLYGIMIDAGSTGSRIHIYRFAVISDDNYELQSEIFKQLEPGLSSYKADAQGAADSLDPLLETAINAVPVSRQASTPISLKATAGLRLLEASQSEDILVACRKKLSSTPFNFKSDGVEIMDGSSEGLFGWVTVNYLLRKLTEPPARTAAVLDLGGGSTQIALSVPGARHLPATTLLGATHYMYLYSHLGYGIMAGRAALLRHKSGTDHPCIFEGVEVTYDYGKESFNVVGKHSSFDSCLDVARGVMHDKQGSFSKTSGAPNPTNDQPVLAMSYYYDRAVDSGIIEAGVLQGSLTPQHYETEARRFCSMKPSVAKANHPTIKDGHEEFMCMDLVFIYSLLTDGFGLSPTTNLQLAKKIDYNGESVETAWSLGASLRDLSDL